MKEAYSLYEEAQILLAGVRLFRHREKRFPTLKDLSDMIGFSMESVHHLCNRLEAIGAVERIRGAFEDRVCLKDPLQAESLREADEGPSVAEDLRKWEKEKRERVREVERLFSDEARGEKKKDLFAEIEERLRKGGKTEGKSPLDALFKKDPGADSS